MLKVLKLELVLTEPSGLSPIPSSGKSTHELAYSIIIILE